MEIPLGYCQCGCGEKTLINNRNSSSRDTVKGRPNRFILSHWNRKPRTSVEQPDGTDYRYISLTHNQVATVDLCDFERLSQFRWLAMFARKKKRYYAIRYYALKDGTPKCSLMHREVIGLDDSDVRVADHAEPRLTLDNRRSNLRIADYSLNVANSELRSDNTSGYKGVSWCISVGFWRAIITVRGKQMFLGYFRNPLDAYAAYCQAALKFYGEFARF